MDTVNGTAVEAILGYSFRSGPGLLFQAITAVGVVPGTSGPDWEGNKRLAQVGVAVSELIIVLRGFGQDASRGKPELVLELEAPQCDMARS
jgi:hypothetical protein